MPSSKTTLTTTLLLLLLTTQSLAQVKGECTHNACLYCMTDGTKKWCSKCGNGHFLSSTKKGLGACIKPLKIENCAEPDPFTPTKEETCGRCATGYYLSEDKKKCYRYVDFKCDLPYMWDGNKLCGGCRHRYIDNDYDKCSKNRDLPRHCLYGDIELSKACLKCKKGYIPSKDRRSCEKFAVKGCKARHPLNAEKCLVCDSDLGWFAVDAEIEGKNVFQICAYRWAAGLRFLVVLVGVGVLGFLG